MEKGMDKSTKPAQLVHCIYTSVANEKYDHDEMVYLLDIIRTNMRASQKSLGFQEVIMKLYNKNGLNGFYRGVGMYNLVTGPNFVIMMVLKENISNYLHLEQQPQPGPRQR